MKKVILGVIATLAFVFTLGTTPAMATLDSSGKIVPDSPSFYYDACDAPIPGDLHATRSADTIDAAYREQDNQTSVPQWARDAYPGYDGAFWVTYAMPKGSYKFADDTGWGWDVATIYDPVYGFVTTQSYWLPVRDPNC